MNCAFTNQQRDMKTHPPISLWHLTCTRIFNTEHDYYKKGFDLVPQRIVPRLAQEFGMSLGVLRAVRAMDKQLRRAFKIMGCLGDWLRATNGILQGCPLSVVFINMLTTAWKK